jgi:hypothetical protein
MAIGPSPGPKLTGWPSTPVPDSWGIGRPTAASLAGSVKAGRASPVMADRPARRLGDALDGPADMAMAATAATASTRRSAPPMMIGRRDGAAWVSMVRRGMPRDRSALVVTRGTPLVESGVGEQQGEDGQEAHEGHDRDGDEAEALDVDEVARDADGAGALRHARQPLHADVPERDEQRR